MITLLLDLDTREYCIDGADIIFGKYAQLSVVDIAHLDYTTVAHKEQKND